jgi:hypothetical protein
LNQLRELQRKSNDIAQEVQTLIRTLEFLRQGAIEHTRVDGSGYCPWPADIITPSHTSTGPIFWDEINHAGAPGVGDPSYASNNVQGPLAENIVPSDELLLATASSNVDIPTAMHNAQSTYRNSNKRYRCQCGGGTERKSDMKRHLQSALSRVSPQFSCVCGERFTREDVRKNHEKKCSKILEVPNTFLV